MTYTELVEKYTEKKSNKNTNMHKEMRCSMKERGSRNVKNYTEKKMSTISSEIHGSSPVHETRCDKWVSFHVHIVHIQETEKEDYESEKKI